MTHVTINIGQDPILYDGYAYFFASNTIEKLIYIREKAENNAKKAMKLIEGAKNIRVIDLECSLNLSMLHKFLSR